MGVEADLDLDSLFGEEAFLDLESNFARLFLVSLFGVDTDLDSLFGVDTDLDLDSLFEVDEFLDQFCWTVCFPGSSIPLFLRGHRSGGFRVSHLHIILSASPFC